MVNAELDTEHNGADAQAMLYMSLLGCVLQDTANLWDRGGWVTLLQMCQVEPGGWLGVIMGMTVMDLRMYFGDEHGEQEEETTHLLDSCTMSLMWLLDNRHERWFKDSNTWLCDGAGKGVRLYVLTPPSLTFCFSLCERWQWYWNYMFRPCQHIRCIQRHGCKYCVPWCCTPSQVLEREQVGGQRLVPEQQSWFNCTQVYWLLIMMPDKSCLHKYIL